MTSAGSRRRLQSFTERTRLTSFQDFGLADPIARALKEENYAAPTPIQSQTIPVALAGRDVIGIAQTGTGKTAAFALPILHRLIHPRKQTPAKKCRVLVLSPTRELSAQILDSFNAYGRHLRLTSALAIGGVPMGRQVRSLLQGVDILVATPGRLLDLVGGNAIKLDHIEFLVLDEADRMLDMGFINDVRKIVAKLPSARQTLFFSATMPKAIEDLAAEMLRDPSRVAVTPVSSTAEKVAQRIIQVDRGAKPKRLAKLLQDEPIDRALVFTRTKHGADKVVKTLAKSGIAAEAIHGNKSQNHRERVLASFRNGAVRTLVATDIAARGIDVDGVSHVVNFDLPNIAETYVHRIGRTARAGAEGIAISLVDADEVAYLRDIEKLIRQTLPRDDQRTGDERTHAERTGDIREHRRPRAQHGRGGAQRDHGHRNGSRHDRPERTAHERPAHDRHGAGRPQEPRSAEGGPRDGHRSRPSRPAHKPSHGGERRESGDGIQNVAFLTRDSRPARPASNGKHHENRRQRQFRSRD